MSKFILAFITAILDLPCSVYRVPVLGLMSLGHYYLHCGKWKHCNEIVFTMEIREHQVLQCPRDLSNYVKVQSNNEPNESFKMAKDTSG